MINIITTLILETIVEKQYVTIYLIIILKFQKNGKIINIKILVETMKDIQKQWIKPGMEKFLVKIIIMILLYKIKMVLQLQ